MKIGFDAKRFFLNNTGLGNYSRDIIRNFAENITGNQYFLFTPKTKNRLETSFCDNFPNITVHTPNQSIHKIASGMWRSFVMEKELIKNEIDIYHGLSNEIPRRKKYDQLKYVVTIHDLIFKRFPDLYPAIDRKIYQEKFQYAAKNSDAIIAISEQTKEDIIEHLKVSEDKIKVIYQSCHNNFKQSYSEFEIEKAKSNYQLPENYLLNVGTIEKRKNLELIIKALPKIDMPLVVVGKKGKYFKSTIAPLIHRLQLENKVIFLDKVQFDDLPIIYQGASIFIYPSLFEGFGIPILESFYSNTPVITCANSSLKEVGGNTALYIHHNAIGELCEKVSLLLSDADLYAQKVKEGNKRAHTFSSLKQVHEINEVYKSI